MPEVRHGARAGALAHGSAGREPRTARHDAALLDERSIERTAAGACHGGHAAGNAAAARAGSTGSAVAAIPARDARGAVGRVAVLRALLGLAAQSQPEHVHAD